MKTTKVILISAITSIVVLGLFVLLIHTVDGCWSGYDNEDQYHSKECTHAEKGDREHAEKKECKKHDAMWAELKVERQAFDEELSADEKALIATHKEEYCNEENQGKCKEACGKDDSKCSEECKKACEGIDEIAANHMESLDAIISKVHEKMSAGDDDEEGDIDEEDDDDEEGDDDDDEMCEKKMKQHKKMFFRHFLMMDF